MTTKDNWLCGSIAAYCTFMYHLETLNRMDFSEQLLLEHSKSNTRLISDYLIANPTRFEEFMHLFFTAHYRVAQRAAWVVGTIADEQPQLFDPYIAEMIQHCTTDVPVATKRNVMRLLQFVDIPADLQGEAYDTAYRLLGNPNSAIAVKCFSMSVAAKIALTIPELQSELLEEMAYQYPHASKGFQARVKSIKKAFAKHRSGKR